ncbi:MarR family winged helix-turn-helix transcriptional regulator [Micromonospora craterilacus]|uniref:MarR family winged helix-turn-helix transcriptional regulator n=1 Tax=Micromonospora craterilacus TaxID=1655439 RepID=UPI0018F3A4E0|nr:MarR family transcriptional regulator [Micromonospora craterilacus]
MDAAMTPEARAELAGQIAADRRALAQALAAGRLAPFLDLDLTLHQLKVVLLVASGTATTGHELAGQLHVTAPTVSATVEKLVTLGYLRRDESGTDRRVKRLTATGRAGQLHEAVAGLRDESVALLAMLSPEDLTALARGTRALREALATRDASDAPRSQPPPAAPPS